MHAVRDRLRPILMTSLAFGLGVLPLAVATGAGAGAQRAIGTGVFGGMLAGTFLGIFFIPVFFVIVQQLFHSLHPEEYQQRRRRAGAAVEPGRCGSRHGDDAAATARPRSVLAEFGRRFSCAVMITRQSAARVAAVVAGAVLAALLAGCTMEPRYRQPDAAGARPVADSGHHRGHAGPGWRRQRRAACRCSRRCVRRGCNHRRRRAAPHRGARRRAIWRARSPCGTSAGAISSSIRGLQSLIARGARQQSRSARGGAQYREGAGAVSRPAQRAASPASTPAAVSPSEKLPPALTFGCRIRLPSQYLSGRRRCLDYRDRPVRSRAQPDARSAGAVSGAGSRRGAVRS